MKTIKTIFVTGTIFLLFTFTNLSAQNIFTATVEGNLEKVKTLIDADTKLLQDIDELGNTPLHIAVANQKDNIAKYLIDAGSDVNAKSNSGETPLHIAAKMRNSDLAALLILKGAFVDVTDASGYTPLSNAIQHHSTMDIESGKLETIKILLENGADINKRGMWNWTPLQIAAEFAPEEIVNHLLDKGADIPIEPGQDSYQVLFASCKRGLTNLFNKLIEKGFDLQVNRYTNGLIHSASAGGSEKIVETLLTKGFKVMTGDGYGWSPLHSAAEKGKIKVVELLINKGADINDRNASGRTPYNLADYFGNKEVCDYLKAKGADTSEQQFPLL
ncbi:MAG: ankyrin repeat domain-containing protein, partial [bacterium]